jgi:hypothetical protein
MRFLTVMLEALLHQMMPVLDSLQVNRDLRQAVLEMSCSCDKRCMRQRRAKAALGYMSSDVIFDGAFLARCLIIVATTFYT